MSLRARRRISGDCSLPAAAERFDGEQHSGGGGGTKNAFSCFMEEEDVDGNEMKGDTVEEKEGEQEALRLQRTQKQHKKV